MDKALGKSKNPKSSLGFLTRNRVLLAGLLLVLVGVGVWMALAPKKEATTVLNTATVNRETLVKSVTATGQVVPNFEVEIKAKASGKILQLPYDVSDVVSKGALLVTLDPIDESRQVSQSIASLQGSENRMAQATLNLQVAQRNLTTSIAHAQADLQAAQAKSQQALAQRQRLQTLVQNRYISQQEYDAGLTTAAQASTDLANARIRLQELQTQQIALQAQARDVGIAAAETQGQRVSLAVSQQRLAETKLYAPIAGVVTTRLGQIGQIVSSGISNVGGGTAIMTLADLSRIFVLASVDESDIGQVREGQEVDITADAFPNQHFQGRVIRIAPKGVEESNVVTFEVKIEVEGANKNLLKPQMTANVAILLARKENALVIPTDALVTRDGVSWVRVLAPDADKPQRRTVHLGLNNGTQVEVLDGVALGEKVVVNGGQVQSRWRREPGSRNGAGGNARGQMMMMRGMTRR